MRLLLTKKFAFEMAHALPGYDGKCANLHGHSYHLEVTVCGTIEEDATSPKQGMVVDFGMVKSIVERAVVERFDHKVVLPVGAAQEMLGREVANLVEVPFQPTTENLLVHFAALLGDAFPRGVALHSLRLAETDSSVAELQL